MDSSELDTIPVEPNLFSAVKYVAGGTVDEKLIRILEKGGAQARKYATLGVTHFIAAPDCNELTMDEAKDVFDIPILTPQWIWYSVKLNKVLPIHGFEVDNKRLFSLRTFTTSKIHREDLHALWGNITYYGGIYTKSLNTNSSYLITNETSGKKYTLAKEKGIKIVCADWVTDCIKAKEILSHEKYHPELLTSGQEISASTSIPTSNIQTPIPPLRAPSVFAKSQPFARPRSQLATSAPPRLPPPPVFHQQNFRQVEPEKIATTNTIISGPESKSLHETMQPRTPLPHPTLQRSISNPQTSIPSQPSPGQSQMHRSYPSTPVSEQSLGVFQHFQSQPPVTASTTQHSQFSPSPILHHQSQSTVTMNTSQQSQFLAQTSPQHQTQSSGIPVSQQQLQFSVPMSPQHIIQPSPEPVSQQHSPFPPGAQHQSQSPGVSISQQQLQFSIPTSVQHQSSQMLVTSPKQPSQFSIPTSIQSQLPLLTNVQQHSHAPNLSSPQQKAQHSQAPILSSPQQQSQVSQAPNLSSPHQQSQHSQAPNLSSPQQQSQVSQAPNLSSPHQQSQHSQAPNLSSPQQQSQLSQAPNLSSPHQQSQHSQAPNLISPQQQSQHSQAPSLISPQQQSQHLQAPNLISPQQQSHHSQASNLISPQQQTHHSQAPNLISPQQQSQHPPLTSNQHQQQPPALIQHMSQHPQGGGIQSVQQQSTFHLPQQRLMSSQPMSPHLSERVQQGPNVPVQAQQQQVFQQSSMAIGMNYQQMRSPDSQSSQGRIFQQTSFQDSIRLQERQYTPTNVLESHLSQGNSFQQTQSQTQINNFQSNPVPNMESNPNINQGYINRSEMSQQQLQQFVQTQNISQIQNRPPGMPNENTRIQYIHLQPQSRMQFQPAQRALHQSQFNQQQQVDAVRRQIQDDPQIRAQWLQMDQQQRSLLIQKLAQRNRDDHIRREMMARQQQLNAQNQNRGIVIQSGGTVIHNTAQPNTIRAPMGQMPGDMQTQGPQQQMINTQGFGNSGQPQPHQYQHQAQTPYSGNHPTNAQSQDIFMHPNVQRPRLRFNPPPRLQHQVSLQYQQGQQLPPQQRLNEMSPQAQDSSFGGQNINQQEKISQHQMYSQSTQIRAVTPQQFSQGMQPDQSSPEQNQMNQPQTYFQTRPQAQNQILVTQGQGGTILRTDQLLSTNFEQSGMQRIVNSPQQQLLLHDNQHQQKVLHGNFVVDPQGKPQPSPPVILTQPQPGLGSPRPQQVLPPQNPQQRINVRHVVVQGNQQQHIILQAQSVPGSPGMQWSNPNAPPQAKVVSSPGQIQRPRLTLDQQQQPPQAQQWIRTSIQGQTPPQGNIIYTNQSNMPFVQVVNSKTKTALANLLSNRLMGSSPEGGSAPVNTIVSRSPSPHQIAQSPLPTTVQIQSRPALTQTTTGMNLQQQQILMQRRTLSNLTNSEKVSQGTTPGAVRPPQHGSTSAMITPRTQYYGHDPNIKLPSDGFLLGCTFWVAQFPDKFDKNLDQLITRLGGELEKTYSARVTHVLCENQMFPEFQHCLREGKRLVTFHWLNDVFKRKCVTTPFYALHLPVPFSSDFKPFKGELISLTGYIGEDLQRIRAMCNILGLVLTPVFTKANMALITAKPTGKKFNKAREWRKAVVNIQFLNEIMFGHAPSVKIMMHSPKYQQFNLDQPFRFDIALVAQLLAAWKLPIRVSNEALEKFRTMKRTLDSLKTDEIEEISCKRPRREEEESYKSIESIDTKVLAEPPKVPQLILLTGFSETFKEMIIKKIGNLGAEVTENIDLASIVVLNSMQLTKKLVLSICKMKDIVSLEWLSQSLLENKFLDPGPFIPDTLDEISFKELLQKPNRHLLFCGYTFYLSPSIYHLQRDVPEIIEAAGGAIDKQKSLKSVLKLANNSRRYLIVTYSADNYLFEESSNKEKFRDLALLNRDNLISWILNQKVNVEFT